MQKICRLVTTQQVIALLPPLPGEGWDGCAEAQIDEGVEAEPDWGLAAQSAPDYEVDQPINWRLGKASIFHRCAGACVRDRSKVDFSQEDSP
jgi:hypothetical protein